MAKSERELRARDSKRNLGKELLASCVLLRPRKKDSRPNSRPLKADPLAVAVYEHALISATDSSRSFNHQLASGELFSMIVQMLCIHFSQILAQRIQFPLLFVVPICVGQRRESGCERLLSEMVVAAKEVQRFCSTEYRQWSVRFPIHSTGNCNSAHSASCDILGVEVKPFAE